MPSYSNHTLFIFCVLFSLSGKKGSRYRLCEGKQYSWSWCVTANEGQSTTEPYMRTPLYKFFRSYSQNMCGFEEWLDLMFDISKWNVVKYGCQQELFLHEAPRKMFSVTIISKPVPRTIGAKLWGNLIWAKFDLTVLLAALPRAGGFVWGSAVEIIDCDNKLISGCRLSPPKKLIFRGVGAVSRCACVLIM